MRDIPKEIWCEKIERWPPQKSALANHHRDHDELEKRDDDGTR